MVPELGELVEDHVLGVGLELVAAVVDLLDVALGAGRADDVLRVGDPLLEPVEALGAHPLGQHGDAAAAHQPRDRHAAAAVVAGRGPDGAVAGRVELAGDEPRREAPVGGEHLVRADHREAVAERDDDRRLDAGQLARQHDVLRHGCPAGAAPVVEPVDAEEVERMGLVGPTPASASQIRAGIERGIGELREGRQHDPGLAATVDGPLERL